VAEARLAGAILSIPHLPKIKQVTSSTMPRAEETCAILFQDLLERKHITECESYNSDMNIEEGSLSTNYHLDRFERSFLNYFVPTQGDEPSSHVIVAHANIIRYWLCKAKVEVARSLLFRWHFQSKHW